MKKREYKKTIFDHVGTGIDRFIGIFNPKSQFERTRYRGANAMFSAYRGAERGYLRENWLGSSGSADQDILTDLPTLRKRSRDLNRNDATAAGVIETVTTNTIGTGLVPQSQITDDDLAVGVEQVRALQKQAEGCWAKWLPYADACNRMHFNDIQNLIDISILENGEAFVMPVMVNDPGRPYRLALDVIEPDRIDTPWGAFHTAEKNVRLGVDIGARGQPIGYYVKKTHPGDWTYGRASGINDYAYVPAVNALGRKNMFHLFVQKRAGQSRGIPFFAPVMTYFKDLCDYIEATEMAARIAACFGILIKQDADAATVAGAATSETDSEGRQIQDLYPAMAKYLKPGESIEQIKPEIPNQSFDGFVVRMLHLICSALNLPYVLVLKDFSKVNYSSARAAILEARKYFIKRQQFMVRYICQPAYEMLLEEAYLNGDFAVNDFYENKFAYCRTLWIAPGWDYIDPLKEALAAEKNIETGVSTLASEATSKGADWEQNLEQRAKELAKKKDLEIKYDIKFDKEDAQPSARGTEEPKKPEDDETPPEDSEEPEKEGEDNE